MKRGVVETYFQGYPPATGATVVQDGLKIIVKGLAVAAASPNNTAGATALKSGNGTVTVTLKADAQASQVTAVTATTGKPVVLADNTAYEFVTAAGSGAAKIYFTTSPLSLNINNTDIPINADIDAELIGYLTALKATIPAVAKGTFKVAGGAITEIETVAAATVPSGTTLFVPGADVKVPQAAVTVTGTLTIGTATDNVSITKGTYTAAGAGTLGVGSTGVVTMADGDALALADTGKIDIKGTGKVVVGATTFDGVGAWTASLGTGATSITITGGASAVGAAITAGGSASAASTLAASGSNPKITQAAGTASNVLDIGAFITIDLKGTATPVGAIVMTAAANPASLQLADGTSIIKTGNTGSTDVVVSTGNGILAGSTAAAGKLAGPAAKLTVTTGTGNVLVSIASKASTNNDGTLTAHTSGDNVTINSLFTVTGP